MTKATTEGERLRARVLAELPPGMELDGRELTLLDRACDVADTIASLDKAVKDQGSTILGGPKGEQILLHPAIGESRAQKNLLVRLLGQLELTPGAKKRTASQLGRKAAAGRWGNYVGTGV